MHVCLLMPCGHLLGKGWSIDSRLRCLFVTLSLLIDILGQEWCLIESIPDLCPLSYFYTNLIPFEQNSAQFEIVYGENQ